MVLWQPGHGPVFAYAKQRPAPFGEYVPLRGLVRLLSSQVERVRVDMLPGTRPAIVPVEVPWLGRTVPVATVIRFEVAFDEVVREAVRNGAELLVVATNSASLGCMPESTQQLAMSRQHAVEHGRADVQISTVGVSAVIGPDSAVKQRHRPIAADAMLAELPLRTSLTPSERLGDGCAAITIALALAAQSQASWPPRGRHTSPTRARLGLPGLRPTFTESRRGR